MTYDFWKNCSRQEGQPHPAGVQARGGAHLIPFFGNMRVAAITSRDVDAFIAEQLGKGLSKSYVESHVQRLGQVLELAREWYDDPPILRENPARGRPVEVSTPQDPDADRWLNADQAELLLHAAQLLDVGRPQTRVHRLSGKVYVIGPRRAYTRLGREAIIGALTFSGLRATELCELTWSRIDFQRRLILTGGTKTQNASRDINITDGLLALLIAHRNQTPYKAQNDPVFATAKGTIRDKDNLNERIIQPVATMARELIAEDEAKSSTTGEGRDIDIVLPADITAHTFRRTFCGFCTEVEKDPDYVRGQMGHADPKFTQRVYNRVRQWSGEPDPRVGAWMKRQLAAAPQSRLRLAKKKPTLAVRVGGLPRDGSRWWRELAVMGCIASLRRAESVAHLPGQGELDVLGEG